MATTNYQTEPSHPPQSSFGKTKDQDFKIKFWFEIYHHVHVKDKALTMDNECVSTR